jgi:uncharacterized Fe-S cluster-containing radical SAM superfamily protein
MPELESSLTPQDGARGLLEVASVLLNNGWLAHAEQQCQAAMRLDAGAAEQARGLMSDIEERRNDPSALDLSQENAPIAVCKNNGSIISTLHFRPQENERLKQEAFRQGVTYIDVETSSQCNRRCAYCPNSHNDRLSSNRFMEDAVFIPFINGLRAIDYQHELHFVGFNEPLMHRENILRRATLARLLLPQATIIVFTNGDYLDREYIDQLITAGVNRLIVSVHLAPGKPYTDDAIFDRINKLAQSLGMNMIPLAYVANAHINVRFVHDGIDISVRHTDYATHGSNRASTLDNVGTQIDVRMAACLLPIHQFVMGHTGKVVPCCTMVSDDPRNASYLVGEVNDTSSIFDVYCGRSMVSWRRSLFNFGPKSPPCDKCNYLGNPPLPNASELFGPWAHFISPTLVEPVVLSHMCRAA